MRQSTFTETQIVAIRKRRMPDAHEDLAAFRHSALKGERGGDGKQRQRRPAFFGWARRRKTIRSVRTIQFESAP